jgi:hypothetical protein
VARFGNRDGLIRGLAPVLLHPEVLFRLEFGDRTDADGWVLLELLELARAIALALTDQPPDGELARATREGRLATREDVRREVERILNDTRIEKPRLLRFFQEYFEYINASTVFKDNAYLLRFVKALEAVPEGEGTMMDNTLIVYTSCHAEAQRSTGHLWPFILIGNLGGRLKSGQIVRYPLSPKPHSRTVNSLWCSLLHAAGVPRDHFNLDGSLKRLDTLGPLPEIMA